MYAQRDGRRPLPVSCYPSAEAIKPPLVYSTPGKRKPLLLAGQPRFDPQYLQGLEGLFKGFSSCLPAAKKAPFEAPGEPGGEEISFGKRPHENSEEPHPICSPDVGEDLVADDGCLLGTRAQEPKRPPPGFGKRLSRAQEIGGADFGGDAPDAGAAPGIGAEAKRDSRSPARLRPGFDFGAQIFLVPVHQGIVKIQDEGADSLLPKPLRGDIPDRLHHCGGFEFHRGSLKRPAFLQAHLFPFDMHPNGGGAAAAGLPGFPQPPFRHPPV